MSDVHCEPYCIRLMWCDFNCTHLLFTGMLLLLLLHAPWSSSIVGAMHHHAGRRWRRKRVGPPWPPHNFSIGLSCATAWNGGLHANEGSKSLHVFNWKPADELAVLSHLRHGPSPSRHPSLQHCLRLCPTWLQTDSMLEPT